MLGYRYTIVVVVVVVYNLQLSNKASTMPSHFHKQAGYNSNSKTKLLKKRFSQKVQFPFGIMGCALKCNSLKHPSWNF